VFVAAVDVVGIALLVGLSRTGNLGRPGTTLILAVLAAVVGAFPVRFVSRKTALTPTHPFILCALAAAGAIPAVLVSLAGVLGATLGRHCRMAPIRLAFNFGAAVVSAGLASLVFTGFGGRPGDSWQILLTPLAIAAAVYFVCNTVLVAIALAIERKANPFQTWISTFLWTTAAYFTGLTLALGLVVIVEAVGAWGLVLGASPVALLVQFYHSQRKRLEESQRRVVEVEALNERLAGTVGELREALAHVNTLQGLLPICMHCKSIRDDNDTWHRLEAYIGEHTDATFTHSVCRNCQEKHYSCVKV
jgi:hypothetical protein